MCMLESIGAQGPFQALSEYSQAPQAEAAASLAISSCGLWGLPPVVPGPGGQTDASGPVLGLRAQAGQAGPSWWETGFIPAGAGPGPWEIVAFPWGLPAEAGRIALRGGESLARVENEVHEVGVNHILEGLACQGASDMNLTLLYAGRSPGL